MYWFIFVCFTVFISKIAFLRLIHGMRFVATTCSIQLLMAHRVNAKIVPTSIKEVKETRLSLHMGSTSCYYKSHHVIGLKKSTERDRVKTG